MRPMPGCESEGDAALTKRFRNRKAVVITERHVENRRVNARRSHQFERLSFGMCGADSLVPIFGEQIAQHHSDERLVVDN